MNEWRSFLGLILDIMYDFKRTSHQSKSHLILFYFILCGDCFLGGQSNQ